MYFKLILLTEASLSRESDRSTDHPGGLECGTKNDAETR